MSNASDVEKTLLSTLASALGVEDYEIGVVGETASGHKVRLLRGWPVDNELEEARNNETTMITLFPVPGMNQERGHYLDEQETTEKTPITVNTEVNGNQVKIENNGTPGQVVGVAFDGTGWSFRYEANESPEEVVIALMSAIPGSSSEGNILTLPSYDVWAGVVSDSVTTTYLACDYQHYRVSVWSWSPLVRDELGGLVRACMTGIRRLALPDGEFADKPQFMNSWTSDKGSKSDTYTKDFQYAISYPITTTEVDYGVLFVGVEVNETHKVGIFAPSDLFE